MVASACGSATNSSKWSNSVICAGLHAHARA
jgi:hypothetical protein